MKGRLHYWVTANTMMAANLLSIIVSLVITVLYYEYSPLTDSLLMEIGMRIGWITDPAYGVIIVSMTLFYERPIRSALKRLHSGEPMDAGMMQKARQRLLNEPYFLIAADFLLWILVGAVYVIVVISQSLIFMAIAIALTLVVAGNLRRPLDQMIQVLNNISRGIFHHKVRITTNDEIGYAGDVINQMTDGLIERELIKDTFGKYVAKEVRDEVLSGRVPLDGEMKDVTVLFADLRDFTPLTETINPKRLVRMMNRYFKEMAEAIQDQGGLVLQFIGDEIYAVFGAPISRPDHPARAFKAGLDMGSRLMKLNRSFQEEGYPRLHHGIGIHTGPALAANIGSPDRLSYLLVGDTVNLASRLQSLTRDIGTEMILSSSTLSSVPKEAMEPIRFRKLDALSVKGRRQSVEAYALEKKF